MENDPLSITHSIDWLEASSHKMKYPEQLSPTMFDLVEKIPPKPRYETAWRLAPAGRLDIADNPRQGVHLTLTGTDLQEFRGGGYSAYLMLDYLKKYGATISRMDFAADCKADNDYPDKPRITDIRTHIKNGWHEGLAHRTGYVPTDQDKGQTEYFGAIDADVTGRAYDKAAEVGMLWEAWVRVELQARNKPATVLMANMVEHGISRAGTQRIKDSLRFPFLYWYNQLMDNEAVELTKVGKPVPKWQRWMNGQVLASIENHALEPADYAFLIDWLDKVGNIMDKFAPPDFTGT